MRMPEVKTSYFPMSGGLDQLTPALSISPGRCSDAQNYEPEISGGYRRIYGFEAYSGKPSPSSANYWLIPVSKTGIFVVGDTLTGVTSAVTFKVLALNSDTAGYLVAGRLSGTLTTGESLTNGVVVGTVIGASSLNGAATISGDADYALLAANDIRTDIAAIPGSGIVRGVWVYNDIVYAFLDNAAATAGNMWKATASGWSQVVFPTELRFDTNNAAFSIGDTVNNNGLVSGTVVGYIVRSGTTGGGNAAGSLFLTNVTGGQWANGDQIRVGFTQKAAASAASAQVTRLPGGRLDFSNYNFTGSTATLKMYGADGVNNGFEFDGTYYFPIRTGMVSDTPSHVVGHKNFLFFSFLGSVQYSSVGAPHVWSAVLGAGELATGFEVTGFVPQSGTQAGSALAIYTKLRPFTLYGSSNADWKLTSSIFDVGYSAWTMQPVSSNTFGLTARGIQAMITTLDYGDFDYASVSHQIQTFITSKRGLETASTSLKEKNQYRLYFSDGTGLAVGLTGDKVNGIMPLNYGIPVRCMCTATLSTGEEVTYFGSDDGHVYRDNIGTSFDGDPIEHWLRLPFNHEKSPRMRKRWRRAILEAIVTRYCELFVAYDLGYGSPDVEPSAILDANQLTGGGAYWDQFNWDQFIWDTQFIFDKSISLDGTEKNISLIFYGNRAQDLPHTIQGITMCYSNRRLER